jgi:hypothetical protein
MDPTAIAQGTTIGRNYATVVSRIFRNFGAAADPVKRFGW